MNDTIEMYVNNDSFDTIIERIHNTRRRVAEYFGNNFMRIARFGSGEEDLPDDFFSEQPNLQTKVVA
ncbi:MAG: hypothetical protein IJQ34_06215 [Kiritimatiellae bacterium]|nr:hypothetical protein [Kiritimatiellia bacterium]